VVHAGEGRNVYRVLVGKHKGKSPLGNQGLDVKVGSKWNLRDSGGGGGGLDSPGSG
jgi:hypothetical protein